eukprot:5090675-Heterocapsa_arctica.AAC.1
MQDMFGRARNTPKPSQDKSYPSHPDHRGGHPMTTTGRNGKSAARAAWNMACQAGVVLEMDHPS